MTTTTSGGGVDAASSDGPASRSLLLLELKRASTRAIAPVDLHYVTSIAIWPFHLRAPVPPILTLVPPQLLWKVARQSVMSSPHL